MADLEPYDGALAPPPFGLANTGSTCYLNSALQLLAGLTAFTRAVLANGERMRRTRTGAAVLEFVSAYAQNTGAGPAARAAPDAGIGGQSARVLDALRADLAERRRRTAFGVGQESASEALTLLLEMLEPPGGPGLPAAAAEAAAGGPPAEPEPEPQDPIRKLFEHRFRCALVCSACRRQQAPAVPDHALILNLFHIDRLPAPPTLPADFAGAMLSHASRTEDAKCQSCGSAEMVRNYSLTMAPEIIVCAFNLYGARSTRRDFPPLFELPAAGGGRLAYALTGQVEHSGSLKGGHYWARGTRAGGRVYLLNDSSAAPAAFSQSASTYLLAYHFLGHSGAPPGL